MAERERAPPQRPSEGNHHHHPPPSSSSSSSSSHNVSSSYSSSSHNATASATISASNNSLRNRYYFSRRISSFKDLPPMPTAEDFVGIYSPWAVLWGLLFLTVPLSYFYIGLVLLRELCRNFPNLASYLPSFLGRVVHYMQYQSWRSVEYWCWLEGVFYILMKLKIYWLQRKDPLEASLSAAPLLELQERAVLWRRMMESEVDDPVGFLTGWFFDCKLENITKYDVCDFCAWSMFEGRHQEHLTKEELRQLEEFVEEAEYCISLQLYGEAPEEDEVVVVEEEDGDCGYGENDINLVVHDDVEQNDKEGNDENLCGNGHSVVAVKSSSTVTTASTLKGGGVETINGGGGDGWKPQESLSSSSRQQQGGRRLRHSNSSDTNNQRKTPEWKLQLPKPKKMFHFAEESQHSEHSFFFNLYESYRNHCESIMQLRGDSFRPVQDLRDKFGAATNLNFHPMETARHLFQETAHQLSQAEETAMATASQMYEQFVPTVMDKHLTAMSHATYAQLSEAWNSVKNMRERLETARFLSQQRLRIRQQLKGYRLMLNRMREMSSACGALPSAQMAAMMRRITECNLALDSLESRAQAAFVKATGFARKNLPAFLEITRTEPRHYARYSSDPLLGIATYPLGFHLLVLGGTEIPLRIMMRQRGFERRSIGPVSYYFHPGRDNADLDSLDRADHGLDEDDDDDAVFDLKTPIIFVHGIGIGLIVYIPLIDKLLETGRPILLPEIPYVSGFRPWQSPLAVLSPGSVVSTMTGMLASHGLRRATWVGHSYGTSWLSYMVKYARHAVASLVFLDPICFSLHVPRLTKSFVYTKPDPGTVSYIVRTDMIVNWTIQRSFPWCWIILFLEQIGDVPCGIFLSDRDSLVPVFKVEEYLRKRQVPICDFDGVVPAHFDQPRCCTVFRGDGHGDWTDRPSSTVPTIATAVEAMCRQAENQTSTATANPISGSSSKE